MTTNLLPPLRLANEKMKTGADPAEPFFRDALSGLFWLFLTQTTEVTDYSIRRQPAAKVRCGILCRHVPEQRLETIRVLGHTMQCQVAHDIWIHRDAGALPADAGSNSTCARSAGRICRETFDQTTNVFRESMQVSVT